MNAYATTERAAPAKSLVTTVAELVTSQRDFLVNLHSQWFLVDMYCRGVQNIQDYDPATGILHLTDNYEEPRFAGYNVMRSTLNRTKSALTRSTPRREAKPTRDNVFSAERARLHSAVMDDCFHRFKIEEKQRLVADGYLKAGAYVASFFLDPTKGEDMGVDPVTGQTIKTGELTPLWDPAERWVFDSRATTRDQVRHAVRIVAMPTEEAIRYYPDKEQELLALDSSISDGDLMENRLLNATQRQLYGSPVMMPKGKGRVVLFYFYEEPCAEYPRGLHAVLAGSGRSPTVVLKDYGFNPYGEIPAVLWVQDMSAYCLLGNGSFLNDLIPIQRELNKRTNAELANSDMCANARMLVPSGGGTPINDFTNDYGEVVPFDSMSAVPPHWMQPPAMPNFHFEAKKFAFEMVGVVAPTSPLDVQQAEKTSSGIHAAHVEDVKRVSMETLAFNWEAGWTEFFQTYVRLFKRLTVHPRQLRSIGPRGQVAYEMVSGSDLGDGDVEVSIVPYSSLPVSRTSSFAEYTELLKVGVGRVDSPLDPVFARKMLTDIGRGDMVETWRNFQADAENAEYIVSQVWMMQPVVPRVQDNPDVVIEKILDEMKSAAYRVAVQESPMIEMSFTKALALFGMFKQIRDQQTALAQASAMAVSQGMASAGQAWGQNAMQASNQTFAPGSPMGGANPTMTQGHGQAANPYRNPGGNPGRRN